MMQEIHKPVIEENHKVVVDTKVISIVEREDENFSAHVVRLFIRTLENLRPSRKV